MSGIPEWNYSAFFEAEKKLTEQGWKVYNPARKDIEEGSDQTEAKRSGDTAQAIKEGVFDYKKSYMWDIDKVVHGNGIFMLKGWENSPGARGEHAAAVFCQK
ncbi:MAG TPA: DUF4406 domain-containing protein, partial [Candidatus Paceibacterota bacterium]